VLVEIHPLQVVSEAPKGGANMARADSRSARGNWASFDLLFPGKSNVAGNRFPVVVEAMNNLRVRSCLIEGEVVCCDERVRISPAGY
jgi:hypothetical protein